VDRRRPRPVQAARLGGLQGLLYYNKTSKYPNCRWFVDSSQASLAAFKGMANDVYYAGDEP
jgi:hypothetical protein